MVHQHGDISRPQQPGATIVVQPVATTPYWARATNPCGATVDTAPVTITITPCDAPAFTIEPHGGNVVTGTTAVVVAQASGTAPLHYQWFEGATGDTSKPRGTDSTTFNTGAVAKKTQYWVQVRGTCAGDKRANSNTATIDVTVGRHPAVKH